MKIASVASRQLLDCKARPLVEVEITTADGYVGRGAAPTGSSVGAHEAFILRDGNPNEYGGLSVHRAVDAVNEQIAPALIGAELDLRSLDTLMIELDGTEDKSRLGGNAIYSTSIALLRASAAVAGLPTYAYIAEMLQLPTVSTIPMPSFNIVNGGKYGDVVQPFNEFIVMPYRTTSIQEAIENSVRVFTELENVLSDHLGTKPHLAPSYGYAAPSSDPRVVIELLAEAIERAGCTDVMAFALDCASSEMYDASTETYELLGERVDSAQLIQYVRELTHDFPFVFVEDLLDENDWAGYSEATKTLNRTLTLGDDLIVTNRTRLQKAVSVGAVDGFILKPNQVGTISEALDCYAFGQEHELLAIPSGRSGGVIDDIVMDLSLGLGVPFQKNGAPRSGERIEKLNFLLRVADTIPSCTIADVPALVRF